MAQMISVPKEAVHLLLNHGPVTLIATAAALTIDAH